MRVRLESLGCRLNEAELSGWARALQARGCELTPAGGAADLVVVNTCAVTAEAVRKSRKLLRRVQRENPRARLVVSGCAASLDDAPLAEQGVDLVVHNRDKDRLVEIAAAELALPLMPETATEPAAAALFARGRQRAFVKIQDGCRYQCTFCVTTRARGAERSRPIAEVCREVERLVAGGVSEVVLTGVHAAGYGADIGSDLGELIAAVLGETAVARLRLGSLEPWDLPPRFWRLFADGRLMPHLHLPLQSGADSVLRRMARRCKRGDFARLVQAARAAVPDFTVTTDLMVGFPGETEAEWRQSLDAVAEFGFAHVHLFAYSPRQGTRAAAMPEQVPGPVKRARSRALHQRAQQVRHEVLAGFVGCTLPVLIEGAFSGSGGRDAAGYTPNYLLVRVRGAGGLGNRIVPVHLESVAGDGAALEGSALR